MKKKLILPIILAVAVLALSACQYVSGPFAAQNGYVACVVSGISADDVAWDKIQGFGGVSVRQGSCDGPAVEATIGVEVDLWQHQQQNFWNLCRQSGLVIDVSTGKSVTITNVVGAGSTHNCSVPFTGQLHRTGVVGHAFIQGTPYVSDYVTSPYEGWQP